MLQNLLLVCASYLFYSYWDWRFLSLIFLSTIVDYFIGSRLSDQENKKKRKLLLGTSLLVNLGILCTFKYYNFFLNNFVEAFSFFGVSIDANSLNLIIPLGISFYTFQTLSYTIDVYKNKIEHKKNFIAFLAFVSFFPQLVAGPIERATNLLPQFHRKREFNYAKAVDGMRQILWGLFKKVVIADNCAEFSNLIFNNSDTFGGSTLLLGAFFFTFQIYCDFSGYSDIAIGTARLFNFNLMKNFAFPYFSRDIAEFWRRWHISLSTWFRDYLYIPLGGSRGSNLLKIRNIFIVFLISGFWHGANWTFIFWGGLHALYFLPLMLLNKNRKNINVVAESHLFPSMKDIIAITLTFSFTLFAWIFFRAENLIHAFSYIGEIFSSSLFILPNGSDFIGTTLHPFTILLLIGVFLIIEWFGRGDQYAIAKLVDRWKSPLRYAMYYAIIIAIFWFGGNEQQFIYFQF
tara:strand:- start:561 stop:1940 length:1380 start_codon:yes stop_codon:yes gene_type:complete